MSCAAKRSKELYDTKVAFQRYDVGDVVWCLMEVRKVGVSPKLEFVYEGPLLVKEKLSALDFAFRKTKCFVLCFTFPFLQYIIFVI